MSAISEIDLEKIVIRRMRDADLPSVQEIDRISFKLPWPNSAFEYELHKNPNSMLWVAEARNLHGEEKIVGAIVIWLIIDEAHIATIAVHPEYRRRGIAKELLKTALTETIQKGFSVASLEVRANNICAQNLYRLFGFEIVGRRLRYYLDNNEDALIMTISGLDLDYLDWMKNHI